MNDYAQIKKWLQEADALVINSGAGMGVDSGLADYRGEGGQWGQVETDTSETVFDIVNPNALLENPRYGWLMYAKRMKEYATVKPHKGFSILLNWIKQYELDYFVLTSNIDGHFQKAGFAENKIRELHGSLWYLQSSKPEISEHIWKNDLYYEDVALNAEKDIFPMCPFSGVMARPNVYMFRDNTYVDTRSKEQDKHFQDFLVRNNGNKILVFEIGSGPHVQSIRIKTRMLASKYNAWVVRINPKDYKIKPPHIGLSKGALEALEELDRFETEIKKV